MNEIENKEFEEIKEMCLKCMTDLREQIMNSQNINNLLHIVNDLHEILTDYIGDVEEDI